MSVDDRALEHRARAVAELVKEVAGEADREVPCCICGGVAKAAGNIVRAILSWNRGERDLGERTAAEPQPFKPEWISYAQVVVCESLECVRVRRAQIHDQSADDYHRTVYAFARLKTQQLDADDARWLRQHGYHDQVVAYYQQLQKGQEGKTA